MRQEKNLGYLYRNVQPHTYIYFASYRTHKVRHTYQSIILLFFLHIYRIWTVYFSCLKKMRLNSYSNKSKYSIWSHIFYVPLSSITAFIKRKNSLWSPKTKSSLKTETSLRTRNSHAACNSCNAWNIEFKISLFYFIIPSWNY